MGDEIVMDSGITARSCVGSLRTTCCGLKYHLADLVHERDCATAVRQMLGRKVANAKKAVKAADRELNVVGGGTLDMLRASGQCWQGSH